MSEESQNLQTGNPSEKLSVIIKVAVKIDKFPINFRFLLFIAVFFCGFLCAFDSGHYFYNKRQLFSAALICAGWLRLLLSL